MGFGGNMGNLERRMKWIRRRVFLPDREPELYHIDSHECNSPLTHYLYTLCRKEVKGHYWDITEDPPESECCPECWRNK
jgi:hypothetical protein